jgi:hypothetical protein
VAEQRERFERDYGCTEAEWQRWLDEATPGCTVVREGPGRATVHLRDGCLRLSWQVLPPRRIALVSLPRLGVSFSFQGVPQELRASFMRTFDLSTQRGGG